jgi:hypothetical protein
MTVKIELSPHAEALLKVEAEARGLTIEEWLVQLAEQHVQRRPGSMAHMQKTDPKAWLREFRAWAEAHDRTTVPLSDEAVSRKSIYPDRA